MKHLTLVLCLLAGLVAVTTGVNADDGDHDHFEGKPAETLREAVANFREYNQRLKEILEGDLSDQDMVEIHELSYTLENALEKINAEFTQLAATLEEVHLASERLDEETVSTKGQEYLSVAEEVVD